VNFSTALIVDDDPVYAALAEDLLLDLGFTEVDTATDGGVALARLDGGYPTPSLMLCDLNMPNDDGVSLIRGLCERVYDGRIIIVSGEQPAVIESVVRLARMQGLDVLGALRKPLKQEALAEILKAAPATPKTPVANLAKQPEATRSLLDEAIDRGRLHPFFQPKVSMATGLISGVEALARIETPTAPHANPQSFVELAERSNRIDALTFAMCGAVAKYVSSWIADGVVLPCAINISPISLDRVDFPDAMAGVIERAGLACSQFTLEVTETRLVEYGPRALDVMTRLRIKGFGLSVDDFGTGYSNIDRLQMFPFTELKIDQSFTRKALEEPFARACVETSVRLAKELGLKIVAEGVETQEMWDFLYDLGIDEAQGFLMSRPLPPTEFRNLLASNRSLVRSRTAA
jgi:EAL domain-containing protein (putative c-di-GMP-specific phosphodiesterase class I)/ActR/RegA family two-component response regulator